MSEFLDDFDGSAGPLFVASAINIFQGGPLTVAKDFLRGAKAALAEAPERGGRLVFFCHRCELYREFEGPRLKLIELPASRRSWLSRLYYEYIYFAAWSRRRGIDCWISLHDITPRVQARRRYVYCHNPAPFYRGRSLWRQAPLFEFFRLFYKYLYRINIGKNKAVIVQQAWLRDRFVRELGVDRARIIVAHPEMQWIGPEKLPVVPRSASSAFRLFYPAVPRPFKNFEILLQMMSTSPPGALHLRLTFDGSENSYARRLVARYRGLPNVEFAGLLAHEEVLRTYHQTDALVFPSKLETWGLPITEMRRFGKPILAADLPYAHEAVGDYETAAFFDPDDPDGLLRLCLGVAKGKRSFEPHFAPPGSAPDFVNWYALARELFCNQG
jgi:glycosyltransferase involved in cell wall biosynthesis